MEDRTDLPATLCATGSPTTSISDHDLRAHIYTALSRLGPREKVLILPPDFTRFHSQAGKITQMICQVSRKQDSEQQAM